ncbi:MAG: hypothetical protein AAF944_11600 [Bacteroidota bacterium]
MKKIEPYKSTSEAVSALDNGMIPIITQNTTNFTMMPLIDKYDVYELRDEPSSDTFLIAHAKGSKKLPERRVKVAGVLKEMKIKRNEESTPEIFLEALYHLEIE